MRGRISVFLVMGRRGELRRYRGILSFGRVVQKSFHRFVYRRFARQSENENLNVTTLEFGIFLFHWVKKAYPDEN